MEAKAEAREGRRAAQAVRVEGNATAADVAAAFERYSASLYNLVRALVDDDEKATRITQASFIAACQALAVGAEEPAREAISAPASAVAAASGPCPKLGYADNPASRYSRPTQLHRCYAGGGAGFRLSAQEQTQLCLTGSFGSCPRFVAAGGVPIAAAAPIRLAAGSEPPTPFRLPSHEPTNVASGTEQRDPPPTARAESAAPPPSASARPSAGYDPRIVARLTSTIAAEGSASRIAPTSPSVPLWGKLVAVAGRSALAVAALALIATAAWIVLILHPWDELGALPSEEDIARLVSVASERAAATAPVRADVAPARDGLEYPMVLTVTSGPAAAAPAAAGQPAVSSQPSSSVSGANVPAGEPQARAQETAVAAAQSAGRDSAVVRKTTRAPEGFAGANLREQPSTAARSLTTLRNGTPVDVLQDTATGDGFTWVRARTSDGVEGWMVSTAIGG